jgi:hypothetical protein
MLALTLTALFASAALLAIAAIVHSWRQYGTAALALRGELKQCEATRGFDYRIITHDRPSRKAAQVIALPVKPSMRRPQRQPALRAAA